MTFTPFPSLSRLFFVLCSYSFLLRFRRTSFPLPSSADWHTKDTHKKHSLGVILAFFLLVREPCRISLLFSFFSSRILGFKLLPGESAPLLSIFFLYDRPHQVS